MQRHLVRLVPAFLKPALRPIYHLLTGPIGRLRSRYSLTPPKSMIFVGDGDFKAIGNEFKGYLIDLAELQPAERVLDVGCGIGRMAVPLTSYLSQEGEYYGFDIVKSGIDWCQKYIAARFSNFHFQHVDIYNKYYNPSGTLSAESFVFPFDDVSFDCVFLTSVFTHMLPLDVGNYVSEISRVLKQDGRCLITFFLLNDESMSLVRAGRSTLDFKYKVDECLTVDAHRPERAIAYPEDFVKRLFYGNKLRLSERIYYGSWCNRDAFLSYQDIVIASKL
jgi:SAM-dependent methyltransferase